MDVTIALGLTLPILQTEKLREVKDPGFIFIITKTTAQYT